MDSRNEYRAAIERELEAALEAIRAEKGTGHEYAWVAGDPKKYERALWLAIQLFRLDTPRTPPLTTTQSAAAIVAAHLGRIPAQHTDEWRHWRITSPVSVGKAQVITERQQRRRQCYVFVDRLIHDGQSFDEAARLAQAHFRQSNSWVKGCYYDANLQAELQPGLDEEYARAGFSKNRDARNRIKKVSRKID